MDSFLASFVTPGGGSSGGGGVGDDGTGLSWKAPNFSGSSSLSTASSSKIDSGSDDAANALRSENGGWLGHKEVESLIAKEMASLSLNEREEVYEDIHGVSTEIRETPEFIETKVREIQDALEELEDLFPEPLDQIGLSAEELREIVVQTPRPRYHDHNKVDLLAYRLAKKQNEDYTSSTKFLLMFLRAECFAAHAAARRLVKFFAAKLHYFGTDCLARPLYYTDLSAASRIALESGAFQQLEQRDTAGRVCFFDVIPTLPLGTFDPVSIIPVVFYTIMVASEDEETQRKGAVAVMYYVGELTLINKGGLDPRDLSEGGGLWHFLPLKLSAIHSCINNFFLRTFSKLVVLEMGQSRRIRTRSHHGSHNEVQYALLSFGIPVDVFPISYDGTIKLTQLSRWIARRKMKDREIQMTGTFEGVELPSRDDVLFGRGRKYQFHPGNNKMRTLVRELYPRYSQLSKPQKGEMAWYVTRELKKTSRFLKQDSGNGYWMPVSDEEACKKVSVTFRKPDKDDRNEALASSPVVLDVNQNASGTETPSNRNQESHPAKKIRKSPQTVPMQG